ncbi:hypothetical protein Tco_1322156 [Tanacetum coccineum]
MQEVVEPVLGSSSIAGNSVAPLPPHENAHVVVVSIKRGRGHPRKSAASAGDVGGSVEVVEQEKKKHRRPKLTSVDSKNLFDRVSSCTSLFSLPERLKAENTIRVNQLATILLIKSSN